MKFMRQFVESLSHGFGHYGRWVYRNQKWVSIGVGVVFVILTLGLVFVESEDDSEYLFAPRGSQARADRNEFRELFGRDDTIFGELAFVAQGEDENLWKRSRLEPILDLHSKVLEIQTNNGKRYEDLCDRNFVGECTTFSILRCFGFELPESEGTLPRVRHPLCFTPTNVSQSLNRLTSHVETTNSSFVDSIKAFKVFYTLKDSSDGSQWEDEFLKFMDDFGKKFNRENKGNIRVVYNSEKAVNRALEDGQQSDTALAVVSFVLISIFAELANISWGSKDTPNTVYPAEASVWLALLCVGPAWGIMSYAGIPYIAMNGVIFFLTVGIGVDDMFIMVSSFTRLPRELSTEERLGKTMEETGVAITITTTTDILAFALGLMSPFRSIQIFCAYMCVSLLWDYILHLTLFLVVLAYDAERDRSDSKCTLKLKSWCQRLCGRADPSKSQTQNEDKQESGTGTSGNSSEPQGEPAASSKSVIETLFSLPSQDYVGRKQDIWMAQVSNFLLNKKAFYVLLFLAYSVYLAFSVYGITNLSQGFEISLLAPDDSHLVDYDQTNIDYFSTQHGFELEITVAGNTQFHLKQRRVDFEKLQEHVVEKSNLIVSKEKTWVEEFEEIVDEQRADGKTIEDDMSESEFRQLLGHVLESSPRGREFRDDLSFVDSQGKLYDPNSFTEPVEALKNGSDIHFRGSKMRVFSKPLNASTSSEINLMDQSREATSSFDKAKLDATYIFPFTPAFIFTEQHATIVPSTISILGTAVAAMFAVAFVLLPSLITQCIVVFGLASIFVGVLGFMSNWGLPLNSVTMVNLLITIGFSIDFTAHMCHAFIHAVGFRDVLNKRIGLPLQNKHRNDKIGIEEMLKGAPDQTQDYTGVEGCFGGQSRRLRASQSLTTMGRPLLNGGISTILGVLALAGGSSFIFRSFFKILLLVLLFGLFHGMVIIPVCLRLIGPAFPAAEESEGRQVKIKIDEEGNPIPYVENKLHRNSIPQDHC